MPQKSTLTKPQKPRKLAASPVHWPVEYDDVEWWDALEAISHGNGPVLAWYLRQADEIDSRVRRKLADVLNPTSNHTWRLHPRQRFCGKPTNQAKRKKTVFTEIIAPLARLLSGEDPIDARGYRMLAKMLDPDSRHLLRLDFKQRKRGRPPLEPQEKYQLGLVPTPIQTDPATLIVRRAAERVRDAKKSGRKLPHKQLFDGTSRATFYRRWKHLRKPNKTSFG
jgi:hypothetical protein